MEILNAQQDVEKQVSWGLSLQDWSDSFIRFLFKYPHYKTLKSDISLGLSKKKYLQYSFPNWSHLYFKLTADSKENKKQLQKIPNLDSEFFFMTIEKNTELLSFIYHLRNAIAHGNVRFENTFIEIRDYAFNMKTGRLSNNINAYCRMTPQHLLTFFKELI